MKYAISTAAAALCAVTVSCTTTGDPTTGGIFWSPAKAQARQQALMSENAALQAELSRENAKTQSLIAQREQLRAQINAKQTELRHAESPAQAAALQREISSLESQLTSL